MLSKIFSARSHGKSPSIGGVLAGVALVGAAFAIGGASKVWADIAPAATNAPAGPLPSAQLRVHELEERVRILELEQEALQRRLRLENERTERSMGDLDRRLHLFEEQAVAFKANQLASADAISLEEKCKNPYVESGGLRRVKPGCESAGHPCDSPYYVDAHGVKRFKPECM